MKNIILYLTIFAALFLSACRSKKGLQEAVPPTVEMPRQQTSLELIRQSIHQRSNFEWFAANLSGSINIDGDYNSFNGQIRIKNGEAIWITITKFGMEIARMHVTPDSVFIHNRFERTATIRDFGFFKEMTGVDFTFAMLQDVLIGNYFLPDIDDVYTYEMQNGNYAFTDNRPVFDVAFDFILHHAHHKFVSLIMRDRNNRSIRAEYNNYAIFNDALYPHNFSVFMQNPLSFELKLNYQKIQINVPQNMPFSIPDSAKRI